MKYRLMILCLLLLSTKGDAQVTVTPAASAATLASTVAGTGITVSNASLTCNNSAEGTFTGTSSLGFTNGVVLTSGKAVDAFGPSSFIANTGWLGAGDANLSALCGYATEDACVLEFDFIPSGNTISMDYVFGSLDYFAWDCSQYNDVMGVFISGGTFATNTYLAKLPGTNVPVCLNSVNCGASPGYPIANCNAMGPGAPFCTYYVNNSAGTTLTYYGLTTTLQAAASVSPCQSYHLKIGVADGYDDINDAGVFLKGGGFTSTGGGGAGSIAGPTPNCVGDAATFTNTTGIPGGTWSSSNTSVASINPSTGVVAPFGPNSGTATITYTTPCSGLFTTYTITVNPLPVFTASLVAPAHVCSGMTFTVTGTVTAGAGSGCSYAWSFGPFTATAIHPAIVTTVSATSNMLLWVTNSYGCSAVHSLSVPVDPLPDAGTIVNATGASGPSTACGASTLTLSHIGPMTGVWQSTPGASVSPLGVVTCNPVTVPTTVTINYLVTTLYCGSASASYIINITPAPIVSVSSSLPVLPGVIPSVLECSGVTLTATATIPSTFAWLPTAGLTPSTGPVVTASPTVTTVYTVTATDPVTGCPGTSEIDVIHVTNPCVCGWIGNGISFYPFGPAIPPASSGTITASNTPPPGNYLMDNDVTISGTVTLSNCIITVNPSYRITVSPGSKLVLDHCHLFSCNPDMWLGIVTYQDGSIEVINNTMIEDANVAIYMPGATAPSGYVPTVAPSPSLPLLLKSSGAIFNKNKYGIVIDGYTDLVTPLSSGPLGYPDAWAPCYPFVIENTVFTSRDFYSYVPTLSPPPPPMDTWPFQWPGTTGTDGLKTPWTGAATPYDPPYNIDNPSAYATGNYPLSATNSGDPALHGIGIVAVGATMGTSSSPLYSGVAAGSIPSASQNDELNMFDNMEYGIHVDDGNVTVRNSVFMHMMPDPITGDGGDGIYTSHITYSPLTDEHRKLYVYGCDGTSPFVKTSSSFYDCVNGVETHNYYNVKAEYATLSSKHTLALLTDPQGQYGFKVEGFRFHNVQLNHNNIYNITDPIDVTVSLPPAGSGQLMGEVCVKHNDIWAGASVGPSMGEYVHQAVSVIAQPTPYPEAEGQVNVDSNDIEFAYNGVHVKGFHQGTQIVTTDSNSIFIIPDLSGTPPYTVPQTGIMHEEIESDYIENNFVRGVGYNVPMPPPFYPSSTMPGPLPILEGIHCYSITGSSTVGCNTVQNIITGFYFEGDNTLQWINNTMNKNTYGYVLNGKIGHQVLTLSGPVPCGNQWLPPVGFWNKGLGRFQTYTMGTTDPMQSILFVTPGAPTEPFTHGTQPAAISAYNNDPSLPQSVIQVNGTGPACPPPPPSSILFRGTGGEQQQPVTSYGDGQNYTLYPNPNDGNATIRQPITDINPVSAEVWNAIGQRIYQGQFHFDGGQAELNIADRVPGLYLLQLSDSKGRRFTLKFTIN